MEVIRCLPERDSLESFLVSSFITTSLQMNYKLGCTFGGIDTKRRMDKKRGGSPYKHTRDKDSCFSFFGPFKMDNRPPVFVVVFSGVLTKWAQSRFLFVF